MKYPYLNIDEMIKETIDFDESGIAQVNSPFHIAYGIDNNFLFGCGVSISSILQNNKNMYFVFHIFIDEISDEDRQRVEALAYSNKTNIKIHIVNSDCLKIFPTTKNWSVAMYFRFVIADYFIGYQSRVLYLDADIICQGDISELSVLPMDNYVACVVLERDKKWWVSRSQSLGCPEIAEGYFNSGVLLLNIPAWSNEYVSGKALSLLSDKSISCKLNYMDQDILNIILVGKVKFIDGKYNTQFSLNYELKRTFVNHINDSTILIHYIGPTKPWHNWASYPSAGPFLQAKKISPWKSTELIKPQNPNYARYCAKHSFKQRKYIKAIFNYTYYFYLKLIRI